MRVSTIVTLDQIDLDAIFQQLNINLKLYALQNFVTKTPLLLWNTKVQRNKDGLHVFIFLFPKACWGKP